MKIRTTVAYAIMSICLCTWSTCSKKILTEKDPDTSDLTTSQTRNVYGHITDAFTGEPVESVLVSIQDTIRIYSDSFGQFCFDSILVSDADTISYIHDDYCNFQEALSADDTLAILLNPNMADYFPFQLESTWKFQFSSQMGHRNFRAEHQQQWNYSGIYVCSLYCLTTTPDSDIAQIKINGNIELIHRSDDKTYSDYVFDYDTTYFRNLADTAVIVYDKIKNIIYIKNPKLSISDYFYPQGYYFDENQKIDYWFTREVSAIFSQHNSINRYYPDYSDTPIKIERYRVAIDGDGFYIRLYFDEGTGIKSLYKLTTDYMGDNYYDVSIIRLDM